MWTTLLNHRYLLKTTLLGSLVLITPSVFAEKVDVITANGTMIASLTKEETADLFLGKRKINVGETPLIPLDVSDDTLRESFYESVADMSATRVSAYWARLVFSAQGRPPRKLPLDEAKNLVSSQPGMVTYTPDDKSQGFKILLKLP